MSFDAGLVLICQDDEDLDVARRIDGRGIIAAPWYEVETVDPRESAILIVRGDGNRLLRESRLTQNGRVLDLGENGSLSAFVSGSDDPAADIAARSRDAFWPEERPFSQWDFPEPKMGVSSGLSFLDDHLRWTDQGELVIVAGPYGCGKSTVTRLLGMAWADHVGRAEGKSVSICGWEDRGEIVKREVARYALGGDVANPNQQQWRRLADMLERVRWTQRLENEERLLSWYAELVEHRVRHHNVGFFIFDPWNEHDAVKPPTMMETEYVRDMMKEFQAMARRLKIIIVIVTHVSAKVYSETGDVKPFRIAQASGSANFGAKATRGICMLRTSALSEQSDVGAADHTVLYFDKNKSEETMGRRGPVACLFDPTRMRLEQDVGATMHVRTIWR